MKFREPRDLSAYTHLTFWVRADQPTKFQVWVQDNDALFSETVKQTLTATGEWQRVVIPLERFSPEDMSRVEIPFALACDAEVTVREWAVLWVDDIEWVCTPPTGTTSVQILEAPERVGVGRKSR